MKDFGRMIENSIFDLKLIRTVALFLRLLPTLLLFFALTSGKLAVGQQVLLNSFNLTNSGSDILLQWELQDEANVTEYRIFRKFQDEPTFTFVGAVPSNGGRSYQYLDDDIFKTTSRVIQYELQVVKDNQIFRFTTSLSHNPTSIQRTWGSIKSMFK